MGVILSLILKSQLLKYCICIELKMVENKILLSLLVSELQPSALMIPFYRKHASSLRQGCLN